MATEATPEFDVLAGGPYVGGPMTRPHRSVVLRWRWSGEFSVHTQYRDDGTVEGGRYYGTRPVDYWRALVHWAEVAVGPADPAFFLLPETVEPRDPPPAPSAVEADE